MLQEMRKYSKSWVANVFLGLLTLSFVSWGVGDIISGRVDTSVAKVGGTSIDQQEFSREYRNALRGENLTADQAKKANLGSTILEQMISRLALDNVVGSLGLTASDGMVTSAIDRIPQFAGLTGQFDRRVFQQTIDRIGYSEQGFIELMRSDMARNQLVHAVEGNFALPPGYARALFNYFMEVRAADYIVVDAKSIGTIPTPTDKELQAFIAAHPGSFSTPEYRDVSVAWISSDDIAKTITIPDDQVKKAYNDHLDYYVTPEKRDLQFLNFQTEAAAQAAHDKVAKGTPFDQITNEKGEKPTPLAAMTADGLADPSVGKAVFATAKGGITQPLKVTLGGYALYRVTAITPGNTKTFDQAKDEIRKAMVQDQAASKLSDISNAYTDASSGGANIGDSAKKAGMHFARFAAVDASGLTPDGSKAAMPDNSEFLSAIVHAEPGEEGDPQTTKNDDLLFVVSVNGVTPPKLKPLDQVRAQAVTAWTDEQRKILIKKKAEALAAEANRDGSLENAAKSISTSVQASTALTRRTTNDVLSPQLVAALFKAKPGQAVFAPKTSGGDYVVARVTGILHPPIPESSPDYKAAVAQLSQSVAGAISESFVSEQRAKQGVKYNTKLMNSVIGSES